MPTTSLVLLLNSLQRPSALTDLSNTIIAENQYFEASFGNSIQQNISVRLSSGPQPFSLALIAGNEKNSDWKGLELPLQTRYGKKLFWLEIFTIEDCNGTYRRLFTMQSMESYRELEAAYLSRIRHLEDDNLWILNPQTIFLWARTNRNELDPLVGKYGYELMMLEDRHIWETAVREAKIDPGEEKECTVRFASDSKPKIINICYLTGGLCGGRFYVACRDTSPTGSRIIRRLKEAWQCSTDKELALKINTSNSAISRAIREETVPPAWLFTTADNTGISLDWLRYGQGRKWRFDPLV